MYAPTRLHWAGTMGLRAGRKVQQVISSWQLSIIIQPLMASTLILPLTGYPSPSLPVKVRSACWSLQQCAAVPESPIPRSLMPDVTKSRVQLNPSPGFFSLVHSLNPLRPSPAVIDSSFLIFPSPPPLGSLWSPYSLFQLDI